MIKADKLMQLLEDAGHEPRSYSGRGMYGKKCVAVSMDSDKELWNLAFELGANLESAGNGDTVPAPKTDSLGLGIVVYWPSIEWVEGYGKKFWVLNSFMDPISKHATREEALRACGSKQLVGQVAENDDPIVADGEFAGYTTLWHKDGTEYDEEE